MLNINMHSVSEKWPNHGEEIMFFGLNSGTTMDAVRASTVVVEYVWLEIDEDGEETGNSVSYTLGDEQLEGHKLALLFDWSEAHDDWFWMYVEDFMDTLINATREVNAE